MTDAAVHHDLTPTGQAQRVLGAGPVEGHGDRSPPVDHDRVRAGVLDVAPPDAPGGPVVLVDTPEEQGARAVGQERDPAGEGGHVVEVWIPRRDEVSQQLLGSCRMAANDDQCVVESGLLGGNLGIGRGSVATLMEPGTPPKHAQKRPRKNPRTFRGQYSI